MTYKYILSLDPSGNFSEGKGTTGWVLWDCEKMCGVVDGIISADKYLKAEHYWQAHIDLINTFHAEYPTFLVLMEDYLLYAHKATAQTNSRMETPKLLGAMQLHCIMNRIPYETQLASAVKNRWTDKILNHYGYLPKGLIKHTKDAYRHAVHYATFKNGGVKND